MLIGLAIVALIVIAGLTVATVAIVLHQQHALDRANRVVPERLTRAPRSWARSHDPEARLHRRLRDAITALRTVNSVDTGTSMVLRADLEQTALDTDDQLVVASKLPPAHKAELLKVITTTVESIEAGVSHYATAATTPNIAALEADLAAMRRQIDAAATLQQQLGPRLTG